MIYSKLRQEYFTPQIKHSVSPSAFGTYHKYSLFDNKNLVGHVQLIDKTDGVTVSFIKNYNPELYKGFGETADQLEVEHCLQRGIKTDNLNITSEAALNSHAFHINRGKVLGEIKSKYLRETLEKAFGTANPNTIVKMIMKQTDDIKKCHTEFLGAVPMFMPQGLIKKYIDIIRTSPLLR